jgi:ATP-dependent Clp protease adaptor protein ClpS
MTNNSELVSQPQVNENTKLKEPSMYHVIYINDSQTSMNFVIDSLVEYFGYGVISAETITDEIHTAGSAVVATFPYEIAEQKGIEVTVDARSQGYPLQIKLEEEHSDD